MYARIHVCALVSVVIVALPPGRTLDAQLERAKGPDGGETDECVCVCRVGDAVCAFVTIRTK